MSLEDQIARLTAAVEKQNSLTEALLNKVPASSAETAKPATESAKKADAEPAKAPAADTKPAAAADPYAISTADFLGKVEPWIKAFAKGTPEGDARRATLAETLAKLGEKKVSEVSDATKLSKLNKWFETKMKDVMLAPTEPAAPAEEDL